MILLDPHRDPDLLPFDYGLTYTRPESSAAMTNFEVVLV
jgi:hypothetical protein